MLFNVPISSPACKPSSALFPGEWLFGDSFNKLRLQDKTRVHAHKSDKEKTFALRLMWSVGQRGLVLCSKSLDCGRKPLHKRPKKK